MSQQAAPKEAAVTQMLFAKAKQNSIKKTYDTAVTHQSALKIFFWHTD